MNSVFQRTAQIGGFLFMGLSIQQSVSEASSGIFPAVVSLVLITVGFLGQVYNSRNFWQDRFLLVFIVQFAAAALIAVRAYFELTGLLIDFPIVVLSLTSVWLSVRDGPDP